MFSLIDHNENNPKIENCISVCRNRMNWGATLVDVLEDKILLEDFGPELLFLCYKAAEILEQDLAT
jgi:hypothetical protein